MVIHVLAVDVGDHGDNGRKKQKAPVALVGFSDENFPLPHLRIGAEHMESTADDHRWIEPGAAQDCGDHRSRCCLAVAARDRDAVLHAHQLR